MVYFLLLQNKNIRTIASGYLWLTVTSPFWLLPFNPSMQLQRKQPCCWDISVPLWSAWTLLRILNLPRELWDCDQECPVSGFPGGAVVENLPASAGDAGSSPGLGGSHVPRSTWAREPQLLSLRDWSLCPATREAAIVGWRRTAMKSGPRLPQLGKALAQKRRSNTAKNK